MKNIKIIYQYDGSDFFGFQRQINKRTVQGEIEKGLYKLTLSKINLISSGRTDRGVHAIMQVSNFMAELKIPLNKFRYVLNNILPNDIDILKVEEINLDFHSRFSAKARAYEFILSPEVTVFRHKYITKIRGNLNVTVFSDILKIFLGKHNFNNFRIIDPNNKNSVREIFKIECYKKNSNNIAIYIEGNAFLKSQIRIMVGSALAVYFKEKPKNYLEERLNNPNKSSRKIVINGSGLYLFNIIY